MCNGTDLSARPDAALELPDLNPDDRIALEASAAANGGDGPVSTNNTVEISVRSDGAIIRGPENVTLSVLTSETFAVEEVDLNALRTEILQSQQRGDTTSGDLRVTPEGHIIRTEGAEQTTVTRLTKETFASRPSPWTEAYIARTKMPSNTRELTVGELRGWVYGVTNELGDSYTFFTHYSTLHQQYRTILVSPNLNNQYGEHQAHLYRNGTCCLTPTVGVATLDGSFARAVLWSNGMSVVRRGGKFPFSYNQ